MCVLPTALSKEFVSMSRETYHLCNAGYLCKVELTRQSPNSLNCTTENEQIINHPINVSFMPALS